jgi:hypothetical protein
MTPREETSLERALGRVEGRLEGLDEKIDRIVAKQDLASGDRMSILARLDAQEAQAERHEAVGKSFAALQQSIRDGRMQAKGIMIGVGLVAGAGGATAATGLKWLWAAVTGG